MFSWDNFKTKQGKVFAVSFFLTTLGLFLPWVKMPDYTIFGIRNLFGLFIFLLLSNSLFMFVYLKSKEKLVSISLIVVGILSFIIAMYVFNSYGIVVSDIFAGIFVRYGPGLYLVLVGSVGICISGVMGFMQKNNL